MPEKTDHAGSGHSAHGMAARLSPAQAVLAIIAVTAVIRVIFAASLGLGVDESYTAATARHLQLGYYDHPPLAWWLAWAGAHLFGGETALALRVPFIALFALTTWLMFILTRLLFGERAGLWAVVTLNCAPVVAWTSGTWVLPDGPLNAALLAGAYCAAVALFVPGRQAPLWWLAAGLCGGLAMMAKLHGVFLFAGIGLFLLTSSRHRHWLASPWPYLGAALAVVVCLPAIIWNVQHGWAAFAFQADRADPREFTPWGPLLALGGQALYLLPWLWLPLLLCLVRACLGGPRQDRQWMLACLAIGPIIAFTLVAGIGTRTLPHWAAPGYLMLFPLLGRWVANALEVGRSRMRRWLAVTAISIAVLLAGTIALAQLPWAWLAPSKAAGPQYPLRAALDWSDLQTELEARGFLTRPNLFVAATGWQDAGKIDYALHGQLPVLCLARNPHAYGILTRPEAHRGQDALIIGQNLPLSKVERFYGPSFQSITELSHIPIKQGGMPVLDLSVYLGRGFSGVSADGRF
ncbi:glycosyltransferase family 39 protein [Methyloligella sp. 2.7D]|uniref:ArnT family glycosyltransferase n=1 Tax=unclassified Methyloligella TaxID=2625955 RepID=UPI00157BE563|nr:glycosyltransferase family 39 protein [Methyloligella sp. GL2]QKP78442.1 glycosyltransferase family 39 protein [Methyloligella sp. GL2]